MENILCAFVRTLLLEPPETFCLCTQSLMFYCVAGLYSLSPHLCYCISPRQTPVLILDRFQYFFGSQQPEKIRLCFLPLRCQMWEVTSSQEHPAWLWWPCKSISPPFFSRAVEHIPAWKGLGLYLLWCLFAAVEDAKWLLRVFLTDLGMKFLWTVFE